MRSSPSVPRLTRRAVAALLVAGALALPERARAQAAAPAETPAETSPKTSPKRIGIIGAGNIGGTLGTLWARAGYAVLFASRNPDTLAPLVASAGASTRAGTPADAIAFADTVLLAVPYLAYPELAATYGAALKGKIVIDAGNAVEGRDGAVYAEVRDQGIAAVSAKYLAGARIVRAFNAANYRVFLKNAGRPDPRMAIPIAGDDAEALARVSALVRDAGFDPVVVGDLKAADRFAMKSPGFGHDLSAPDLKARLGLAP